MVSFSICHKLPKTEAISRLDSKMQEAITQNPGVTVNYSWKDDALSFNVKGVKGTLTVEDKQITVSAEVPFLLRPFAGKAEKIVRKEIKEALKV